jgi:hypothetical protein
LRQHVDPEVTSTKLPVIYLYLDRLQSWIAPGRSHVPTELPAAAAAE